MRIGLILAVLLLSASTIGGCTQQAVVILPPEPEPRAQTGPSPWAQEPGAWELNTRHKLTLGLTTEAEWRAAHRHLSILAARWKDDWVVALEYGRVLYRLNAPRDEVEEHLRRSLQLRAKNPRALLALGQVHEDAGELQEAEDLYREAISIRDDELDPHLALARVLRQREKFDEAVEILLRAKRKREGNMLILVQLAAAQESRGSFEEAEALYLEIVSSHHDELKARTMLYRFYLRINRPKKAEALVERITELKHERTKDRELRPLRPSRR